MKDAPVKPTLKELKEEFILLSQVLTAAIDAGSSEQQLKEIRDKIIAIIDKLHIKALETRNKNSRS